MALKLPDHFELVLGALAAGTHVYFEWSLGSNLAETEELAAARSAKLHVAIGVQTRTNPAALRAKKLITTGAIGRVLSARLYSGTVAFSPKIGTTDTYLECVGNGATLVEGGQESASRTATKVARKPRVTCQDQRVTQMPC